MGNKERLESLSKAFAGKFGEDRLNGTVDEFYGSKERHLGLWVSGESFQLENGEEAFDAYSHDGGVHPAMLAWLDEHGVYAEFHDAGTVMIYFKQ